MEGFSPIAGVVDLFWRIAPVFLCFGCHVKKAFCTEKVIGRGTAVTFGEGDALV